MVSEGLRNDFGCELFYSEIRLLHLSIRLRMLGG